MTLRESAVDVSAEIQFEGRPWFESSPEIPKYGGMLDFNCHGIGGCTRCGWRGAPTFKGAPKPNGWPEPPPGGEPKPWPGSGEPSTFCPACGVGDADVELSRIGAKVSRNALCPCGSGRKFKKCCGR